MPDASVSHDHGRGQELSSEYDSGCDLGIVTEKSSTTIAPETAPPPSDGDSTAESSGLIELNGGILRRLCWPWVFQLLGALL